MITVKDAIKSAMSFVRDMFGAENVQGLQLEEVELSQDESLWYVTLSFSRSALPGNVATAMGLTAIGREYKTVAVQTADGVVRSVKIRQLV